MRPDIPAYQVTEKMTEMQGAQAVGAWQHWMSTLYGLESDVYGDQHFSARLGTFELGAVGMTRIEAGRHRVRRTSASIWPTSITVTFGNARTIFGNKAFCAGGR